VEAYIFEKADFETNRHDLAEVGRGSQILSAGTEISEREVPGPRQLEARRNNRGVKIHDGAELNLESELHRARRERFAAQNPASAVRQGRGKIWQESVALLVAETLDIEKLHSVVWPPRLEFSAVRFFIGAD
jgi:hypothetical protein